MTFNFPTPFIHILPWFIIDVVLKDEELVPLTAQVTGKKKVQGSPGCAHLLVQWQYHTEQSSLATNWSD